MGLTQHKTRSAGGAAGGTQPGRRCWALPGGEQRAAPGRTVPDTNTTKTELRSLAAAMAAGTEPPNHIVAPPGPAALSDSGTAPAPPPRQLPPARLRALPGTVSP